jgi:hypothetical protein
LQAEDKLDAKTRFQVTKYALDGMQNEAALM